MRTACLLPLLLCAALHGQLPSRAGSVDEINKLPEDTTSINLDKASNEMLEALARFKALTRVSFNSRNATADDEGLAHVGKLATLTELHLNGCEKFTDAGLEKLLTLAALKKLTLQNGKFSDAALAGLAKLPKLEDLSCTYNGDMTGECFAAFKGEHPLRKLNLTQCIKVAAAGYKAISTVPALEGLVLSGTLATVEGVAALTDAKKLEELTIGGPGMDDATAAEVAKIATLERLTLGQAKLTDAGAKHFAKLRKLSRLTLTYQPIGDGTLEAFREHPELETLNLTQTRVTAAGLAVLKTLPRLNSVNLSGVQIGADGAKAISECKQLDYAYLNDCGMDDAALAHLAKMTQLTSLDLSKNPFTAEGAMKLVALTNLRTLDLGRNSNITAEVVAKLKETLKDTKVSYDRDRR